jgi:hypothetical protein
MARELSAKVTLLASAEVSQCLCTIAVLGIAKSYGPSVVTLKYVQIIEQMLL